MTEATVHEELAEIAEKSSATLIRRIRAVAQAEAMGSLPSKREALAALGNFLADVMARADLAGRRRVLGRYNLPVRFEAEPTLLDRIMELYRAWHGPTLAKDASKRITDRVAQSFEAGRETAVAVLSEMNDWTVAYADTVYRNNVATAYSAGQWKASMEPEVLEIVPAKEYSATGDSDTRPNHQAADGLIAGVTDPIWNMFSPPMGHKCRCALLDVDRFDLEDRKLIRPDGSVRRVMPATFAQAHPDPGWITGRPDLRIYGRK